jgi:hypothetical protein
MKSLGSRGHGHVLVVCRRVVLRRSQGVVAACSAASLLAHSCPCSSLQIVAARSLLARACRCLPVPTPVSARTAVRVGSCSHRGALSTLYDQHMPSVAPPRGRDQTALRRTAAPPEAPPPPLGVGPEQRGVMFSPDRSSIYTKLNFSEPFLGGDEVNLQCVPSHRTRILTVITAV